MPKILLALVLLASCEPGACAQKTDLDPDRIDYDKRQRNLSLHQVAPGVCVVVMILHGYANSTAITGVPCPTAEKD